MIFSRKAEVSSVVECRGCLILFQNWFAFLAIFAHKLIELLVAAQEYSLQLKLVPTLFKDRLDVGLVHREISKVEVGAVLADKDTKCDVGMRAPVFLAVDTKGVELVFMY